MDLTEVVPGNTRRHPWELARLAGILALVGSPRARTIADIGAGDLFVAQALLAEAPARLIAVDTGYPPGTRRGDIELVTDLGVIAEESVDLALLMDVLEHERDDRRLLAEAFRKVRPGGCLLITVPAFPCLYSPHDVSLKHLRRYRRRALHDLLSGLRCTVEHSFHFFSLLFLIRAAQCALHRLGLPLFEQGVGSWRLPGDHPVTRWIARILTLDFSLARRLAAHGLHLPGLSICLVIRKPSRS